MHCETSKNWKSLECVASVFVCAQPTHSDALAVLADVAGSAREEMEVAGQLQVRACTKSHPHLVDSLPGTLLDTASKQFDRVLEELKYAATTFAPFLTVLIPVRLLGMHSCVPAPGRTQQLLPDLHPAA